MDRKKFIFLFANILIPLCIGFLFYCFHDRNTYINDIFPFTITMINSKNKIYFIMSNWGCDFLWSYALFFVWYWYNKNQKNALLNAISTASILELLQLINFSGIKCGTFDWCDILVEFTGIIIAMLINKFNTKGK